LTLKPEITKKTEVFVPCGWDTMAKIKLTADSHTLNVENLKTGFSQLFKPPTQKVCFFNILLFIFIFTFTFFSFFIDIIISKFNIKLN
jgi:hypothetical protein